MTLDGFEGILRLGYGLVLKRKSGGRRTGLIKVSQFTQRAVSSSGHYDVTEHFNLEQLPGTNQVPGDFGIVGNRKYASRLREHGYSLCETHFQLPVKLPVKVRKSSCRVSSDSA